MYRLTIAAWISTTSGAFLELFLERLVEQLRQLRLDLLAVRLIHAVQRRAVFRWIPVLGELHFDRPQQGLRVHRHARLGAAVHGVGHFAVDALQPLLHRQVIDGRLLVGRATRQQCAGERCSENCWFHDGSGQKL